MGMIETPQGVLQVDSLDPESYSDYRRTVLSTPDICETYTLGDYSNEKRGTEDLLRHALGKHWKDIVDYEVGWDENYAFTLCGGIYTPVIISRGYLEVLYGVLQSTRHKEQWSYNTSVELDEPLDGAIFFNFTLRGNTITVCNHGMGHFDFVRYFSRV